MLQRFCQAWLFIGLLSIACDENEAPEQVEESEVVDTVVEMTTMAEEEVVMSSPTQMGTRTLIRIGDEELSVLSATPVELSVEYASNGVPIVSERIDFRLIDSTGNPASSGIGGSLLESQSALTDAMGVARVRLRIGAQPVTFSVEATAAGAEPLNWRVQVEDSGLGSFEVRLIYGTSEGRYGYRDFEDGEVFLFDEKRCDAINSNQVFGAYLSATRAPFDEVENLVRLDGLPRDMSFSIVGVAYNHVSKVVSYGCVDDQVVVGGEIVRVDLSLNDVPLEYKGRFNIRHTFNLAQAFQESGNETLVRLEQVLGILQLLGSGGGDRGDAVVQLFCDLARTDLCTDVVFITRFGGAVIDRMIDNVIAPDAPQVFAVFQALSDLVSMVHEMSVIGQFEFLDSSPDNEGYLRENENRWQKFEFNWRMGCPSEAECTRQFTLAEIHSARGSDRENSIFAPFDARIRGNNMEIGSHQLVVRFGLIMLGLAESWIIPSVVAAETDDALLLKRVLEDLLPCGRVDDALQDTGFCQDILVQGLSDAFIEVVGDFRFPDDGFTLQGSVTPVDEDGDLVIDKLMNGRWVGDVGPENTFFGCFNGCRGFECEPQECTPPQN